MSSHPEFILSDVFVSRADLTLDIFIENSRQLFHFVPLRIQRSNRLDIGDRLIGIQ